MTPLRTDVFIAGAGPAGLVLAIQLRRLGISVQIVDSADKASPDFPMYGRACTLYPRTLEMLDQLDLFDELAQKGFISPENFSYFDGKKGEAFSWDCSEDLKGTFFQQVMNLRLKYSEDIFREKLREVGTEVQAPVKVVGVKVDDEAEDDCRVEVECVDTRGNEVKWRAKYIVGSDGGRSSVRKLAGIQFSGEHSGAYWVRIDGVVRTNFPDSRIGGGTLISLTHGNVLFVALDHGATRIGYPLTDEMIKKYGRQMTQQQAVHEAKLAMAPFELEFETVDWYTVYSIGQMLSDRLITKDRILLAGDAAHTHSSGMAQGMNTGMHDVVSLAWRLAGVLKGWYRSEVLTNYSDERLEIARQLINYDKEMSTLISGKKPDRLKDNPENPSVILRGLIMQSLGFLTGLTISYPPNLINDSEHALQKARFRPGSRPYDVILRRPGHQQGTIRLFEATKNNGKFHVLVFTGKAALTRTLLRSLQNDVNQYQETLSHAVDFFTIIDGTGYAIDEHLGVPKFGKAYWDADSSAHQVFTISEDQGTLIVLRPDGIVGAVAGLDQFVDTVVPYLNRVVIPRAVEKLTPARGNGDLGELINPFENIKYKGSQNGYQKMDPQSLE